MDKWANERMDKWANVQICRFADLRIYRRSGMMGDLTPILALLAGLGFLSMWMGLTIPRRVIRAAAGPATPQQRIVAVENMPFFQDFLYSLVRGLVGWITPVNEQGELTSANERYLLLLKQADWYWAPGELNAPTPSAPFWNLETLWGSKVVSALAGGALGFVVLLVPALAVGLPPFGALFGAFIGALQGWITPDSKLRAAVKKRQHELIVEMATASRNWRPTSAPGARWCAPFATWRGDPAGRSGPKSVAY
jgi:hypothetical protein